MSTVAKNENQMPGQSDPETERTFEAIKAEVRARGISDPVEISRIAQIAFQDANKAANKRNPLAFRGSRG